MRLNVDVESREYAAFQSLCRRGGVSMSFEVRRLIVERLGADYFSRHGVVEEDDSNGGVSCITRMRELRRGA
jgi:hypothetical protein